jgi:hypothetical protein
MHRSGNDAMKDGADCSGKARKGLQQRHFHRGGSFSRITTALFLIGSSKKPRKKLTTMAQFVIMPFATEEEAGK